MTQFDVERIRKDFPILETEMNGKKLAYLDNAATTQKPIQVINAVSEYYKNYNANIHRGVYSISIKATEAYTGSKELTAELINADSYRNIVYNRNATEGLNIAAISLGNRIKKGDHILISSMEHHSNMVPWQLLAKRKSAILDYISMDSSSSFIDMESYSEMLEKKPKIVSFSMVSNVLGTVNDAKKMTKMAHDAGAIVIIDGAQAVPHMKVDVKDLGCELFAFSSHKMLGPSGIGILYGKEDFLEGMEPVLGGGDMIRSVDFQSSTWNELPWKFEAGTPNVEGAIGFGAAVAYINKIGIGNMHDYEIELTKYAIKKLNEVDGVKTYGPGVKDIEKRVGVIPFNVKGAHPHDVAQIFDSEGIAIRAGHHCAMPLVNKVLNETAISRMSLYLYNTREEIDRAVNAIDKVKKVLKLNSK